MAPVTVTPPGATEPALPDGNILYEVVNGQVREVSPMGAFAGIVASQILRALFNFGEEKKLGLAMTEVLFRLRGPELQRRPDVAFVSFDRLPDQATLDQDPPALDLAPNLAVEVVSPSNTAKEIEEKLTDYFANGVDLVWVVHPTQRLIYVYEARTRVTALAEGEELDGAKVLPGFRVKVGDLFAAARTP